MATEPVSPLPSCYSEDLLAPGEAQSPIGLEGVENAEAAQEARHGLGMEPRFPMAHSTLGWACLKQGRTEEGLEMLRHVVRKN